MIFHNGSIYDNHLIIKQISEDFNDNFTCAGENTEKYITFSMDVVKKDTSIKKKRPETFRLRFIDNYRFMGTKLDRLVKHLAEPCKYLSDNILKQRFYNTYQLCDGNMEKIKLLLRKGVYPYEYMDSWEKIKLSVPLNKKHYYSELNDSNINDSDIKHVKNICSTLNINNLGEYHDLYVQSDTTLLADVFENFRNKCLAVDNLDPTYYLSAPGLSWQSGLKVTGVTLELLTDQNMLLLFEKGIRGGICEAVTKYKQANNKYMKNYDTTKPSSYLMYVDANNLYGYAMSKKLPYGNFEWIKNISIFTEDYIKNSVEESDIGYLLVVDVTYLKKLYEDHKYFPFLPDKTKIDKVTKLSSNLDDKKYYTIHISALKQALNHGLKLETVYNAISFSQDAWLKPYIDRNTEFRMNAANEFEKDYYKLLNNSFYGKTMENVRKHRDIRLVNTDSKRSKLASEPNYYSTKHISEDLLIMEMKKRDIYMNKPLYLEQTILDHSKMLMYEFW